MLSKINNRLVNMINAVHNELLNTLIGQASPGLLNIMVQTRHKDLRSKIVAPSMLSI